MSELSNAEEILKTKCIEEVEKIIAENDSLKARVIELSEIARQAIIISGSVMGVSDNDEMLLFKLQKMALQALGEKVPCSGPS